MPQIRGRHELHVADFAGAAKRGPVRHLLRALVVYLPTHSERSRAHHWRCEAGTIRRGETVSRSELDANANLGALASERSRVLQRLAPSAKTGHPVRMPGRRVAVSFAALVGYGCAVVVVCWLAGKLFGWV